MIGILTFVGTQSHGACLQAFALKNKILKLGCDVEIINYECSEIKKQWLKKKPQNAHNAKKFCGALIRYPIIKKRYHKFRKFEACHLGIQDLVPYIDDKKYDRIIVGSDQVWNLEITGRDNNYFLAELDDNAKKFSYAASMGVEAFDKDAETEYINYIRQFQALNVREKQLCTYLQKMIPDKKIETVLDPTLLFNASEWDALVPEMNLYDKKYLLVHYPADTEENWKTIRKLAGDHHLDIIYITNQIKPKPGCVCLYAVDPFEYLNYIRHADIVVTGSFHTLCFSLIFNKQFYYTESMVANRNSRLSNLLELVNCENQLLTRCSCTPINYSEVNERLASERVRSAGILVNVCREKE